jgi:hypothetical protein
MMKKREAEWTTRRWVQMLRTVTLSDSIGKESKRQGKEELITCGGNRTSIIARDGEDAIDQVWIYVRNSTLHTEERGNSDLSWTQVFHTLFLYRAI